MSLLACASAGVSSLACAVHLGSGGQLFWISQLVVKIRAEHTHFLEPQRSPSTPASVPPCAMKTRADVKRTGIPKTPQLDLRMVFYPNGDHRIFLELPSVAALGLLGTGMAESVQS